MYTYANHQYTELTSTTQHLKFKTSYLVTIYTRHNKNYSKQKELYQAHMKFRKYCCCCFAVYTYVEHQYTELTSTSQRLKFKTSHLVEMLLLFSSFCSVEEKRHPSIHVSILAAQWNRKRCLK